MKEKEINLPDPKVMDSAINDYVAQMREYFPVPPGTLDTELSCPYEGSDSNHLLDDLKQLLNEHNIKYSEDARGVLITTTDEEVELLNLKDARASINEKMEQFRSEYKSRKLSLLKEYARRLERTKTTHASITGKRSNKSYIPPHQLKKTKRSKKGKRQ